MTKRIALERVQQTYKQKGGEERGGGRECGKTGRKKIISISYDKHKITAKTVGYLGTTKAEENSL